MALKELTNLGADVTIPLGDGDDAFEDALKEQFAGEGIDVVLDYLWGKSAERVFVAGAKAGKHTVPIRFVQIGAMSGSDITLPSTALRSSAITLMGSGIGSIALDAMIKAVGELMHAAAPSRFKVATKSFPLQELERVWPGSAGTPRIVFKIS